MFDFQLADSKGVCILEEEQKERIGMDNIPVEMIHQ